MWNDEDLELIAAHHQHKMRVLKWSIGGPIVIAAVAILLLWWTAKPAHAEAARPFYCTTLEKLPRTCASAQVLKRTFGAARAERMARKCGATDAQIAEAKACE